MTNMVHEHRNRVRARHDPGGTRDLASTRRDILRQAGALAAIGAVGFETSVRAAGSPAGGPSDHAVALITGCSSGFGQLTALTLARRGLRVFASMRELRSTNWREADRLRELAQSERLSLEVIELDVRHDESVMRAVRRVADQAGRIDVLVNNAGILSIGILETQTLDEIRELFETNTFGSLRLNRAVLPIMRRRNNGLIVQVSSGTARIVLPFSGAYEGAKFAIEALTEVTRYEVSRFGIDAVLVEPGSYATDLIEPNARRRYERYLERLSHEDRGRLRDYGDFRARAESQLHEPPSPDPQQVADAIARLIDTPTGQRPLRTLVGPDAEQLQPYNEASDQIQAAILQGLGWQDMLQPRSTRTP